MRRLIAALLLALTSGAANATTLLNTTITTAVSAITTAPLQIRPGPGGQFVPTTMAVQATFARGAINYCVQ
jgi:hypothetical protein